MLQDQALTVIGSGSYGTALAIAVASKGFQVCLYSRNKEKAVELEQSRENAQYLKGIIFPETLHVTGDLESAVHFARDILLVVPSAAFSSTLQQLKGLMQKGQRLAWATKGLEYKTGHLLSQVVTKELGFLDMPMAALSGPTFAREVAMGMPTAIACAGTDSVFVQHMCEIMHTKTFRIYHCHDFIALQLGGAVKNVIAIAAGMSDGLGYGANARTALISRGLAEMIRLGLVLGATERGFMGLSGMGDLILTCTDDQSRNRRFGRMLGQGLSSQEALDKIGQVVEGWNMVHEVHRLAEHLHVEMPICNELYNILVEGKPVRKAAQDLLSRQLTAE